MRILKTFIVSKIILVLFIVMSKVETKTFFTSTVSMETLLLSRNQIINGLEIYLKREKERIDSLSKLLKPFRTEIEKETQNPKHVENPYYYFKLHKRLTIDLNRINAIVIKKSEYKRALNVKYPSKQDLHGTALAMLRLQIIYRLNVSQIANTELRASHSLPITTSSDCYELARHYIYELKYFTEALPWLFQSLRKCKKECDRTSEMKIVKHISNAYFYLDDVTAAFKWRERYLNKTPIDPRIIRKYIDRINRRQHKATELSKNQTKPFKTFAQVTNALCRGEIELPKSILKSLSCFYKSGPHPFLHLARVKVEQLYTEPSIILYYDVITDNEILHLKKIALPKLSWIGTGRSGSNATSIPERHGTYRVSETAYVTVNQYEVARRIQRRIQHLTGLIAGQESLAVCNYGVGGLHGPHYDFYREQVAESQNDTNKRIATMIFYLSDVPEGGATVFLHAGLTVWQTKGAALYWPNLHPSGDSDLHTEHAACPVLKGSKWTAVVWKTEIGQELAKPCTLKRQKMTDVRRLHPLIPKKKIGQHTYGDSVVLGDTAVSPPS